MGGMHAGPAFVWAFAKAGIGLPFGSVTLMPMPMPMPMPMIVGRKDADVQGAQQAD